MKIVRIYNQSIEEYDCKHIEKKRELKMKHLLRKTFAIYIFLSLFNSHLSSQSGNVPYYVDYAQYMVNKDLTKLEVYFAVERSYLRFDAEGSTFTAKIMIRTDISVEGKTVLSDSVIMPDRISRLTEIVPGQKLTNQSIFIIRPGDYKINVTFTDMKSFTSRNIEKELTVRTFSDTLLQISDIEIASRIEGIEKEQIIFDKNGLRVLPNPQLYYGGRNTVLNFYVELYNLAYDPESENIPCTMRYAITDPQDNLVKYLGKKQIKKTGTSTVLNGGVDVSSLNTGTYYLKLMLYDSQKKETTETKKIFYVQSVKDLLPRITAPPAPKAAMDSIDEYENMTAEELNDYFAPLKHIASKEENEVFKKLDDDGKRSFIVEFWRKRDSNPNTPGNEFKAEFLDRLKEANKLFSRRRTEGWKTDMGKVMLRFGKPNQVDRNPGSGSGNAYEIWNYYEIQGGVYFVFVDKSGVSRYELVHSTCEGEIYDPDWSRYLKK